MSVLVGLGCRINRLINLSGEWLAMLFLRFLLFWEFWESGVSKLTGQNWFGDIQDQFPFPFNIINPDISWFVATWAEIIGAIAILFGIFTRFMSAQLVIVTAVAIIGFHFPRHEFNWESANGILDTIGVAMSGYDGNEYKLGFLFIAGLIVLAFKGPGKISVDALINRSIHKQCNKD